MLGSLVLVVALASSVPGSEADPAVEAARAHRSKNGAAILGELVELLRLPNVASDLPGIRRNAERISELFTQRGVTMRLLEIEGAPPIVLGRLDEEGATRTLGLYVHYDGQPVQTEAWTDDPWTPTLYTRAIESGGIRRPLPKAGEAIDAEWRLYGRASSDDKAPLVAMLAALDALATADVAPTSNLLFFFEGEEEAGSPHLA